MTLSLPFPHITDLDDVQKNFETLQTIGLLLGGSFSGAGLTTVTDSLFPAAPTNGALAVHYDSTAGKTYLSVRANGVWHVMAGPV